MVVYCDIAARDRIAITLKLQNICIIKYRKISFLFVCFYCEKTQQKAEDKRMGISLSSTVLATLVTVQHWKHYYLISKQCIYSLSDLAISDFVTLKLY